MAKSKLVKENQKIEAKVVGDFNKMDDSFVDNFLTKEGESVPEAREMPVLEKEEREWQKVPGSE